jgi:hypothetical protein
VGECGLDLRVSGSGPVVGCFEDGSELSSFMTFEKRLTNVVTLYFSRTLDHLVVLFGSYLFFIICRKVSSAGRIPVQSQRAFLTVFYLCHFHR